MSARIKLVEATLRALPEILRGQRLATEVLFPSSSMELVEGIYKNNAVADYFNETLAAIAASYVDERLRQDAGAKLRILEIGAGTGGCSAAIFAKLAGREESIEEYTYTDVSKAFLLHAEERYGSVPYLKGALFDVEQPLSGQGIEAESYDVVVASNALHATRNIRQTVRNAKAALKRHGILLLNEITAKNLFAHVTFGLTDGWWRFEDAELRLPGCPALSAESWESVLQSEGFSPVLFPARQASALGQQIIAAESDGVIRAMAAPAATKPHVARTAAAAQQRVAAMTAAPAGIGELLEKTQDYLRKECAELLRLPSHQIDPQAPLEAYGIDSILVMKLTNQLEKTFGSLSKTLFFEYQTIRELSGYFIESHSATLATLFAPADPAGGVKKAAEPAPRRMKRDVAKRDVAKRDVAKRIEPKAPAAQDEPIAIIGLSGRYPEAFDLDAYWRNLRDGKDCIIEVPKERWDWKEYFSDDRTTTGHHFSKWGGFITGVDEFDPLFFNISPKEAKTIDPQERLFLQHAWMAIEDAGYTRAGLQVPSAQDLPGQVGVYVGVMYTEYQLFGADASARGQRLGIAPSAASIANRVSYTFNLHGPSITLDTMCSSSLTAIHFACQDLKLGRTTLAIAGGVNVSIHPNKYLVLSAGQFISSDGHCQSFGEGSDGFIPGEGVGVVVLKRLSEAKRDGDFIYGIIRGSALNHGGKTNGYTVPNPQAQTTAITRALADARIDPRHISYLEAHGTGTKLGDPIEIAALNKAFQTSTQDTEFCRIGSAKSNIGHCEGAAGIAGLTKVLLQMQHRQIVPSLHSAELNPHIDFPRSPFVVNQTLTAWEQPAVDGRTLPRVAGISSFGAGGANAHLIVEEYPQPLPAPLAVANVAIVLSARTAEQLQQKARELADFIRPRLDTIDLAAMAHTLQLRREAMDERLGVLAGSHAELLEKLEAYGAGQQEIDGVYAGEVKRNKEALSVFGSDADLQRTVSQWLDDGKLSRLLELWVKGLDVDWSRLYGGVKPVRVSLPAYPFARERYWIDVPVAPVSTKTAANAVLHPLLHRNTSSLTEQRYSSTFTGDEFFLHGGILPAAAYLEMARVAIEKAAPDTVVELRDVVWSQSGAAVAGQEIHIALLPRGADGIDYEIYSTDAGGETVHCQGRAVSNREPAPPRLDLEQLERQARHRGSGQLLARLRLPADTGDQAYVLHPAAIDGALHAAVELVNGERASAEQRVPFALDTLRILSPCTATMSAWVRLSAGSDPADAVVKVDVDLCDERGLIAVQMRGVGLRQASAAIAAVPAAPKEVLPGRPIRTEFAFVPYATAAASSVETKKPVISLAAPGAVASGAASTNRAPIALTSAAATADASAIRLYDDGNGVVSIQIAAVVTAGVIAQLRQALEKVRQQASVKVLLLRGLERLGVRGAGEDFNDALEQKLFHVIVAFPYPVIAVLPDGALGAGFLAAALCDFMVCSEDASYGFTDLSGGLWPGASVTALLDERFGARNAHGLLYQSQVSTGAQLRAKGWTCPILPAEHVEARVQEIASAMAASSQKALGLLKQHLSRELVTLVDALQPVDRAALADDAPRPESVLVIDLGAADPQNTVAELRTRFAAIRQAGSYRAIVLSSGGPEFLANVAVDDVMDLQRLVIEADLPVIAALSGNAKGRAWLAAQLCDDCVYNRQGVYSASGLDETAAVLFAHRLGSPSASEILLTAGEYSGADLQRHVPSLNVADADQILPMAVRLAVSWARLPRANWKKQSAVAQIDNTAVDEGSELLPDTPARIELASKVVTAIAHPDGVVAVRIEDREAKNMFSDAVIEGVAEVFAHIAKTPAYKVVVLTGYDSYFASGGTRETLLAIQEGRAKFTDATIFRAALDCRLPVIAAMQGHGLGAGWAMGMFADIVLLSEESRYVSPYMSYGFTPGAGATYILPRTIGQDLARESLLTAQPYTGRDLRERGVPMAVLRRADVYPAAMAMAARIARSPRGRLIALKQQLTQSVYGPLDETVRRELAMHEQTFVGQSDTLAKIQSRFEQGAETAPPAPVPASATPPRETETLAAVAATLRTLLANELALRESDVDDNIQFLDIGLDSISGVTWVRKINEKYQISIEATKVYSYPTLAQLSRHVKEELDRRGALSIPGTPAADVPVVVTQNAAASTTTVAAGKLTSRRGRKAARFSSAPAGGASEPIAVIGMAGQFPQARNLEEFWRNIAEGRNCISEVPAGRWDVNAYYQEGQPVAGKTNSRWVGALDEYDRFDPLFFNLSPTEAENMDPQQRLFLQACWHSIENAGYDVRILSGSKCGVFVGCSNADYYQMARQHQWSAQGFTGSAMSILAARISYFLNLQGPCVSIDTACSSSLVALAQACDSLNSGASDLALAGGVYVMAGPGLHVMTAQANMLSPQGRCFTFDQRADGFVPGEGVGVVLLKRLADAQRDQDNIYGIVEGWGLNQDGKTNGITAPNPDSQTRLEQDIYDKFAIDPENIQLIEAHGTGTKLGDPIEVEGLRNAFRKYTRKTDYCALGSVKSNIGHCLTAAGIAGVIKLLLALEHKQLPPTLNFEQLNEHIDLNDSPFFVNTRLQDWDARGAQRRQAAISSFGFSGTNAHIVLGEPPAVPVSRPDILHAKTAIPLSARTPEQLRQKARDLLDYLRQEPRSAGLQEVAYTLQAGRTAMDERLAFEVTSTEQLIAKLDAYLRGERAIDDAYEGQVKRNRDALSVFTTDADLQQTVEKWIVNGKLSRLLDLWVKGLEVDWNKLYGDVKPRRVALPAYPFAKERYWIDTAADAHLTGGTAPTAVLHPLLHANTSDLGEQRYSSTFTGHELFLADHRVRTDGRAVRKVLPGVAYLEMARAAVERATPARPEGSILELHDTVWLQPLVVSARTEVSIALHATDGTAADYEIYGSEAGQRTVYCEGRARFTGAPVPPRIDVEHLKAQMERGRLEPAGVYATFAHMGLEYGPAHQGITAIHVGERQLLAELRLPSVAETGHEAYELHPSLLDSALQAAIGLADPQQAGAKPYVPFVLESLRVIAPCTREMVAWVRYAAGSKAGDRAMKLDLDVCDRDGNVCVQMRGFVSRILDGAAKVTHEESDYALIPDRLKLPDEPVAFDDAFYQKLIADIVNRDLSVDEAVSLG